MRIKIIVSSFLVILNIEAHCRPWYEYADNLEVDEAIEKIFKPDGQDRESLSENLYVAANNAKQFILSAGALARLHQIEGAGIATKELTREAGQNALEKWWEYQAAIELYFAFLIRASDLGHKQAQKDLAVILSTGVYGIDIDKPFAQRLSDQASGNDQYLDPKPLNDFLGSKEDLQFITKLGARLVKKPALRDGLAEKVYQIALRRLSQYNSQKSKECAESYVFLLKKAVEFGHFEAKKLLINILHEGTYGVKRDNGAAKDLECEVEKEISEAIIPMLSGIEAYVAKNYSKIEDFHYNPIGQRLEIGLAGKTYYFTDGDAETLYKIITYLMQKGFSGMEEID